ncbi:MAG: flagellar hook-length control protein FliK [Gammaproteobacteria bacterium]
MTNAAQSLAPAAPPVATPPAAPANTATAPASDAVDNAENKGNKADAPFLSTLVKQMRAQSAATGDAALAANVTGVVPLAVSAPTDSKAPRSAAPDGTALPPSGQDLPIDPTVLALLSPLAAAVASATGMAAASTARTPASPIADFIANRNPLPLASPTSGAPAAPPPAAATPATLLAELSQYSALTPSHNAVAPVEAATPPVLGLATAAASAQALPPVFTVTASTADTNSPLPATPSPIAIPLAQPGWDQALGQRVQWVLGQQMQGAELRINPPHLGPIEVRVSMGQDQQTTINFASPHGVVRDAIESALPRLRDMLGDQGMNQVNVNVSQHSFAEQRRQAGDSQGDARDYHNAPLSAPAAERVTTVEGVMRSTAGLVDYFV